MNTCIYIVRPHPTIYAIAHELMPLYQIDQKDAIHCACAIFAECDLFLTVDKKLLKKINRYSWLKALNPLDFLLSSEECHENWFCDCRRWHGRVANAVDV